MDGTRLFSVVPRGRTKGSGHNLQQWKFCEEMTEHWNRLHGEVVESPSPEICKSHVETTLDSVCYGTLLEQFTTLKLEMCPHHTYLTSAPFGTS